MASSGVDAEFHFNKHFECDECGKHFIKLGQLYDHVNATKHMAVHCSHCGIDITTWKERLKHFAFEKHALIDGPIFTCEVKYGPPNPRCLENLATLRTDSESDDDDCGYDFPRAWWDDENDILIGLILSFRPNGTTTSKGLQKVLQLPFMRPMLHRVLQTDGSLDCFLKRRRDFFQSEPMYKLRLKMPREETIKALVFASLRPQHFVRPIVTTPPPGVEVPPPAPAFPPRGWKGAKRPEMVFQAVYHPGLGMVVQDVNLQMQAGALPLSLQASSS
eukprot:EG_transcript_23440